MVDNMAELVYRKMGAKIRYYRQLKGINQTDFAIKVSISSQYLSKIENGKRIPSLPVLLSIAEALEVDVAVKDRPIIIVPKILDTLIASPKVRIPLIIMQARVIKS